MLAGPMTALRLRSLPRAALRPICALAAWGLLACGPREGAEAPAPPAEAAEAAEAAELAEVAEPAAPEGLARPGPTTAHWTVVDTLREAAALRFHPSDGGGRAWLESAEPERPPVSSPGRFRIAFEVGPLGIATGGLLTLQVSPFWGWSTPQVEAPEAPGYTVVTSDAPGALLEPATLGDQLLGIVNRGRPLAPGERVRIDYGAGPERAATDRFAERGSRFWLAVDGDGDGVRKLLDHPPGVDVVAGPPARLVVHVPGVARPGEAVPVSIAVLDAAGSAGVAFAGEIALRASSPAALELPASARLAAGDGGVVRAHATAREPGVAWVEAGGPGGLDARSNPILVTREGPRVLWADLHGHSALSDGTGTPAEYLRYARDVAALDAVALTDHDHWGMVPLDAHPELWRAILTATEAFHEPGRFVTLGGYEWTSWIYGHRHVLTFEGEPALHSSFDPRTETPQQLWQALEGRAALTFAHHPAGGPIAVDWSIPPDPRFEPVTEIVSVHGSSESPDTPMPIYDPVDGHWVRDALARGYRLGFVGSGDSHDGHPGLAQLASSSGGGVAAILSEERTREGVLAALRARRAYATNGPRILLRAALGPHPMGSVARVPEGGSLDTLLFVHAVGTGPIARVELVRSGAVVDGVDVEGRLEVALERPVEGLRAGEYVYVRVVQEDDGAAWSSPIFVEAAASKAAAASPAP
jgi:hypothetical protein